MMVVIMGYVIRFVQRRGGYDFMTLHVLPMRRAFGDTPFLNSGDGGFRS